MRHAQGDSCPALRQKGQDSLSALPLCATDPPQIAIDPRRKIVVSLSSLNLWPGRKLTGNHSYFAFMVILFPASAFVVLGMVTVNTPLRNRASALLASTSLGSGIDRLKEP